MCFSFVYLLLLFSGCISVNVPFKIIISKEAHENSGNHQCVLGKYSRWDSTAFQKDLFDNVHGFSCVFYNRSERLTRFLDYQQEKQSQESAQPSLCPWKIVVAREQCFWIIIFLTSIFYLSKRGKPAKDNGKGLDKNTHWDASPRTVSRELAKGMG